MSVIFHKRPDGSLMMLIPSKELPLETIAAKDVPYGEAYKVVSVKDLPDIMFFGAWEVDFSNPDGHGAPFGNGTTKEVVGWDESLTPITVDTSENA